MINDSLILIVFYSLCMESDYRTLFILYIPLNYKERINYYM